jgi:hypothetical protein
MDASDGSMLPELATWKVFTVIVALLLAALVLEIVLSRHWTDPFLDPGTWVVIGVGMGLALRAAGGWLARRGRSGEEALRRLSLAVWIAAAVGGLMGLFL